MIKTKILTFEFIEYNEESHDFTAWLEGMKVKVDPYVGCVWEHDRKDTGRFTFEGFWSRGCFLAGKEIIA